MTMTETPPVELKPEVRPLSPNSAQSERASTSGGDDWLCLSWLDRSDQPLPQVRPSAGEHPTIDGYELLREIGRGEAGIVYFARDRKVKRRVAIKLLREKRTDSAPADRVRRDAESFGPLKHPNIVPVFDTGEHLGRPYLVMEYVDGPNLKQLLDGKPLLPRRAAELLERTARAVQHAHERGIVHRRLKPGHLLYGAETEAADPEQSLPIPLAEYGVPKILNFWVANRPDESGDSMAVPAYLAPEQTETPPRAGPEADVFAFGSIFYEMLVGMPPFNAPDAEETIRFIRNREPLPPSRLQPGVPRDLESFCLKCLSKDPRKRYVHAGELADDLRRYLEGRSIKARPLGPIARLVRRVTS